MQYGFSSLPVHDMPLVSARTALVCPEPGTGVAGNWSALYEARMCAMGVLLILLLLFFGYVVWWSGTQLYRMLYSS